MSKWWNNLKKELDAAKDRDVCLACHNTGRVYYAVKSIYQEPTLETALSVKPDTITQFWSEGSCPLYSYCPRHKFLNQQQKEKRNEESDTRGMAIKAVAEPFDRRHGE